MQFSLIQWALQSQQPNFLHHCFKNSVEFTYWEEHNENQTFRSLKCYTEKTILKCLFNMHQCVYVFFFKTISTFNSER